MADQDLDRSEAATPHKLEKAREEGQIARSTDFVSAAVFAAAVVFVMWQGRDAVAAVLRLCRAVFAQGAPAGAAGILEILPRLLAGTAAVLLPFFAVLMAAAIAGTLMHAGGAFSAQPLKMDMERINPASGLRRAFSVRTLFDAAKACAKLAVLVFTAWMALKALMPQFHALSGMPAGAFLRTLVDDLASLGVKMALALGIVALLDLLYTRREFARKMRMSRRELKDEMKNREGDPRIRQRLRELRREALKRSLSLRNTRQADVVLANPTHYAVALRYVHGQMESPQVVAKGAGQLAAAMRELAARHRIPVVRNPRLARQLFRELDVDQQVPPSLYADVARIIVWVFAMRQGAARGAAA